MTRKSLVWRSVGFSLIIIGLILFSYLAPIAASQGILATWISMWPIIICIALGSFILLHTKLRVVTKSLIVALALLLPWSTIFFLPLPSEIQLSLAAFVALIATLLYRYYHKPNSFLKLSLEKFTIRKAAGIILAPAGLLLSLIVISVAIQYGIFLALVVSLPAFFIMFLGCSLILDSGFKRAALWWLLFIPVIVLPWIAILPLIYQVTSYVLLVTIFISVLLWYRRRFMSRREREKTEKETPQCFS